MPEGMEGALAKAQAARDGFAAQVEAMRAMPGTDGPFLVQLEQIVADIDRTIAAERAHHA